MSINPAPPEIKPPTPVTEIVPPPKSEVSPESRFKNLKASYHRMAEGIKNRLQGLFTETPSAGLDVELEETMEAEKQLEVLDQETALKLDVTLSDHEEESSGKDRLKQETEGIYFGSDLLKSIATDISSNGESHTELLSDLPQVNLPDSSYKYSTGRIDWSAWTGSTEPKNRSNMVVVTVMKDQGGKDVLVAHTRLYMVNIKDETGKILKLMRFYQLQSEEKGKGVGSYVMRQIQQLATELGVDAVFGEMGTLDADAEKRRRFYERNGFRALDENSGDKPGMAAIYWKVPKSDQLPDSSI